MGWLLPVDRGLLIFWPIYWNKGKLLLWWAHIQGRSDTSLLVFPFNGVPPQSFGWFLEKWCKKLLPRKFRQPFLKETEIKDITISPF